MKQAEKENNSWIWWLAAVIIIAGGYWAWQHYKEGSEQSASSEQERTVAVAPLVEQDLTVNKEYIGYVTPINQVVVHPYISGFLEEINVSGGEDVKIGEVLLVIEQSQYKAMLDSAKAAVSQAQADYNNAWSYYKRVKNAGTKAVSATETDNAKAKFLAAQAALSQAKANQEEALVNYNYTVITATIDGIIGNVALTKGDYVSPQVSLLTIIQYNPIRVVFSISDKDYLEEMNRASLFEGERILLKLADGRIYPYAGKFQYSDNQIDRSTNSISMYADFDNPDRVLVANAYVTVLVEKKYKGMVVRKDLVSLLPEGDYIYVANGDNISRAQVSILSDYGNNYILKNSFKDGDKIVLDRISGNGGDLKYKISVRDAAAAEEKN